jgi:hypothetical protein
LLGGGDGTAQANDDINVVWSRDWSDGFHQQIDIRRIARHEKVGFQPLNCQHPAQLPGEVAVLAPGTVRNLVCGAIVTPVEGAYGNQERHPGRFVGGA